MLFLHNTSHLDDEPYPTLLKDKGFRGFPSLAFMDAEGNVLAKPASRTVESYDQTLGLVESYVSLKAKIEAGDASATNALFLTELELDKLTYEGAKAQYAGLEGLSTEQCLQIEAKLAKMEVQSMLASARTASRAKNYDAAAAIYRKLIAKDSDNWRNWYSLGSALLSAGEFDEAIEAHAKVAGMEVPASGSAGYNVACAYALKGETDQAFEWLHKAVAAGYRSTGQLKRDSDLESLREDPRFAEVIAAMEKAIEKAKQEAQQKGK